MRTTLTIDDDLAAILRRESKQKALPLKDLVNSALRRGLTDSAVLPPANKVVTRPHPFGFRPGIDLDKLNQLSDELEAEAFAASHVHKT
jgi:hypothetical protein